MAKSNPAFDMEFYEIHVHGKTEKSYRCTLKGKSPDEKENVFTLPRKLNKAGKPMIQGKVDFGICTLGIPRWLRDEKTQFGGTKGQTDWDRPVSKESLPPESLKDILRKAYGMAEDAEVKRLIGEAGKLL